MKSGLKPSVLGLLLLPLLGAATGCSSPDPAPEAVAPASSSASSPASSAKPKPSTSSAAKKSAAPSAAPTAPAAPAVESSEPAPEDVVQSPEPAPVPTFDAPQTEFLQDKVAEGTDPNAVLQVGQEHCDRLLSTKALDPDAVASELIMNPNQDIADAITSLCPELLPELEAAGRGFPDGMFSVGAAAPYGEAPSVAPGTYRVYGMPPGCTVSVYSVSGGLISSSDGSVPVIIGADAAIVESDQCYSWLRS